MKIRAFNIDWDTDGEVVEGLPKEVIIDDLPDCQMKEMFEDSYLADELSDRYGWCINSLEAEIIGDIEDDPEYGRCETCNNYGKCYVCSDCDEGSEYEYNGSLDCYYAEKAE